MPLGVSVEDALADPVLGGDLVRVTHAAEGDGILQAEVGALMGITVRAEAVLSVVAQEALEFGRHNRLSSIQSATSVKVQRLTSLKSTTFRTFSKFISSHSRSSGVACGRA